MIGVRRVLSKVFVHIRFLREFYGVGLQVAFNIDSNVAGYLTQDCEFGELGNQIIEYGLYHSWAVAGENYIVDIDHNESDDFSL